MRTLVFTSFLLLASSLHGQSLPPTALVEGLGIRLYETDTPEPLLGLSVAGEEVWVATGSTDSDTKSRVALVAPSANQSEVEAFYLRRDGTLGALPMPGRPLDAPMVFNHEGTTVASTDNLTVFLTNDGLGAPGYSYVRDTRSDLAFEVIRRNGERWGNGA